jgi:signal transduction histidine kinase
VDQLYLPRIVDNLVSNAVKFTERGGRVTVRVSSDDAWAIVEVSDTGPGLTDADMKRVFGKRERLSARPTNGEGSSGLGLYIVRQLVESHGGDVSVRSTPGMGANFVVKLPLAIVDKAVRDDEHCSLTV